MGEHLSAVRLSSLTVFNLKEKIKMDTSIRLCTMDDLNELCALSISTFYETFAPMNTPEGMKNYLATSFDEAKFRRELSDSNTSFFFVYSGEELAGYMKLNEAPSQSDVNDSASLEIERIYVLSKYQGEGIGALLMDKAISAAVERGKEYIWLGVWEKNEKALAFYKKHEFRKIGEHSFVIGSDVQTDHLMRLDLK